MRRGTRDSKERSTATARAGSAEASKRVAAEAKSEWVGAVVWQGAAAASAAVVCALCVSRREFDACRCVALLPLSRAVGL